MASANTTAYHSMDIFADKDVLDPIEDALFEHLDYLDRKASIRNRLAKFLQEFDGELPSYEVAPEGLQKLYDDMWTDDVGYWEDHLERQEPVYYYGFTAEELEYDLHGTCFEMIDAGRIVEDEPVLSNGDSSSQGFGHHRMVGEEHSHLARYPRRRYRRSNYDWQRPRDWQEYWRNRELTSPGYIGGEASYRPVYEQHYISKWKFVRYIADDGLPGFRYEKVTYLTHEVVGYEWRCNGFPAKVSSAYRKPKATNNNPRKVK